MCSRFIRATGAVVLALGAAVAAAAGDAYPNKPIRFIVRAAGGPTEIVTRLLAERMTQSMGVPVIVEAKPGAGGNIGADTVAKAAPDGYTILMGTIGTNAINQTLYKSMPYQPLKDLVAVTQVVSYPLVVVVNPKLPINSVADLIAYAKSHPGELNRASGGSGTSMHMSGELFNEMAGIKMQHIPYKGSLPALTDVMGGQADLAFDSLVIAQPLIKAGKLRAIAVTGSKRSPAEPDVPSVSETLPGYAMTSWIGVFAPAGTPRPVVDRLQQEIAKAWPTPRSRRSSPRRPPIRSPAHPMNSPGSRQRKPRNGRPWSRRPAPPFPELPPRNPYVAHRFPGPPQTGRPARARTRFRRLSRHPPGALHYLSGAFMPWRGAVLVTASGHCEFIYWAMDAARVRAEGHDMDVHEFEFADFPQLIRQRLEHHGLAQGKVALDLAHPGAAQIAPGMLTAAEFFSLSGQLPKARFENGVDVIDDLMLIKDAAEIERLRHAAEVSDYGFEQGMNAVRAGATENEIAGEIERAIRRRGSTWSWAVTGGTEVGRANAPASCAASRSRRPTGPSGATNSSSWTCIRCWICTWPTRRCRFSWAGRPGRRPP